MKQSRRIRKKRVDTNVLFACCDFHMGERVSGYSGWGGRQYGKYYSRWPQLMQSRRCQRKPKALLKRILRQISSSNSEPSWQPMGECVSWLLKTKHTQIYDNSSPLNFNKCRVCTKSQQTCIKWVKNDICIIYKYLNCNSFSYWLNTLSTLKKLLQTLLFVYERGAESFKHSQQSSLFPLL